MEIGDCGDSEILSFEKKKLKQLALKGANDVLMDISKVLMMLMKYNLTNSSSESSSGTSFNWARIEFFLKIDKKKSTFFQSSGWVWSC